MSAGSRTPTVLGRRVCAVLAAGSAALHLMMIGHAANPVGVVVVVAMAVGCVICACELWRASSERVWCSVAVMNLAMIGMHIPAPAHRHEVAAPVIAIPLQPVKVLATGVALSEVLVASAVLCVLVRRRRAQTALIVGLTT